MNAGAHAARTPLLRNRQHGQARGLLRGCASWVWPPALLRGRAACRVPGSSGLPMLAFDMHHTQDTHSRPISPHPPHADDYA